MTIEQLRALLEAGATLRADWGRQGWVLVTHVREDGQAEIRVDDYYWGDRWYDIYVDELAAFEEAAA